MNVKEVVVGKRTLLYRTIFFLILSDVDVEQRTLYKRKWKINAQRYQNTCPV